VTTTYTGPALNDSNSRIEQLDGQFTILKRTRTWARIARGEQVWMVVGQHHLDRLREAE
jgi:hypothetical protein